MRIAITLLTMALMVAPAKAQTVVGQPALDFSLESLDGDLITLSDLKGQVVLLFFLGYT